MHECNAATIYGNADTHDREKEKKVFETAAGVEIS